MAKIAIDARHINSTTGRYIQRLVQGLAAGPGLHEYVLLMQPGDIDRFSPSVDWLTAVAAPFALYGLGEQLGLLRLIDSLAPDLVHFCMPAQPILYRGRAVTTFHDLTQLKIAPWARQGLRHRARRQVASWAYKRVALRASLLITPSETTRREVLSFARVDPDAVRVTYEAADLLGDERDTVDGLEERDFLLYVGAHTPYKNVRTLVTAHANLRTTHPDLLLVFVGRLDPSAPGSAWETRVWSEGRGYGGIVFTGYVSDAQLAWLYERALAYVFPSYSEGFGLPGLEAMAHGAPVISSNASCLPEIYGDAAIYFDPSDVGSLLDAIVGLVENPELREGRVRAGREQAASYSWTRMVTETLDIYNDALT